MVEIAACAYGHGVQMRPRHMPCPSLVRANKNDTFRIYSTSIASSSSSPSLAFPRTADEQPSLKVEFPTKKSRRRVFFLDVNPLCYQGSTPSLQSFGHWISLFFSQVTHHDPVIAVLDGERGNEHRQQLLPSYKAHRRKFLRHVSTMPRFSRTSVERSHQAVINVLKQCNVPVVKVQEHEADDVVATLVGQVLQKGYRAVIASPDKDFKQLISEDVQIVMPVNELQRWSFYTLKHYISQHNCDPQSDLSLRCIVGDDTDGVPGIQNLVPAFGRKTALKLLKKHGSLDNLLNAAAVRTVGKPYAQEALTSYADFLRRNYQVLALRRDVDVHLQEEWLIKRNTCSDSKTLSAFFTSLEDAGKLSHSERPRLPIVLPRAV